MVIDLRDYQKLAIVNLKSNGWTGILEMATGTGKTFTSIAASLSYYRERDKIFRVILVPYSHLVDQWKKELKFFNIENIITCYSFNRLWELEVNKCIRNYNLGFIDSVTLISTYETSNSKKFIELFSRVRKNIFLIADECHHLGVKSCKLSNLEKCEGRLGLSATPDRWWDEGGTSKLYDFFDRVVYKYSLKKAISKGYLVNYRYEPIIVGLDDVELEEYKRLTRSISIMIDNKEMDDDKFLMTTLKRKNILDNAKAKEELLLEELASKDPKTIKDTLIYCTPQNIDRITQEIGNLGIRVRKFNYQLVIGDREEVLENFSKGVIQVLTAIKCLDEGVDIPSVRQAYFLASTSNPREFIQRRGRVLRTHPGKNLAIIKDYIILPSFAEQNIFESIAKIELPRFAEFSYSAINSSRCRKDVSKELRIYNLEYLMDKLPWEVYQEEKERWLGGY